MDDEERKAWEETLYLWHDLSEMIDHETGMDLSDFKRRQLHKLGLKESIFGCPLCQRYNGNLACTCPLGTIRVHGAPACIISTPYGTYLRHYMKCGNKHSQVLAKNFYNYLLRKAEERGY